MNVACKYAERTLIIMFVRIDDSSSFFLFLLTILIIVVQQYTVVRNIIEQRCVAYRYDFTSKFARFLLFSLQFYDNSPITDL